MEGGDPQISYLVHTARLWNNRHYELHFRMSRRTEVDCKNGFYTMQLTL